MTLGVFHQVHHNLKATEEAIKSFRQFHPKNPYVLIRDGDNGEDFSGIAKEYDCLYLTEEKNLGYRDHNHQSGIYGMTKDEVLIWLERFRMACTLCNTDHIIMMEDDVHIRGEIHVPEDWEFAGQAKPGNLLQEPFTDYLTMPYTGNPAYTVDDVRQDWNEMLCRFYIKHSGNEHKAILHKKRSMDLINDFEDNYFDFIFIDPKLKHLIN